MIVFVCSLRGGWESTWSLDRATSTAATTAVVSVGWTVHVSIEVKSVRETIILRCTPYAWTSLISISSLIWPIKLSSLFLMKPYVSVAKRWPFGLRLYQSIVKCHLILLQRCCAWLHHDIGRSLTKKGTWCCLGLLAAGEAIWESWRKIIFLLMKNILSEEIYILHEKRKESLH